MLKSGLIIFFLTLISYSFYYKFKSNKNIEVEITKPNKFLIEKASKWPIWEKEVSEFLVLRGDSSCKQCGVLSLLG